jgi:hypothetical protein
MAAPKNMTPEQRSLRARIAAHTQWSLEDNRTERTAAARKAAEDRFVDLVDPDRKLPPEERAKRAANARSAHFSRMAAASAASRRRAARTGGSAS